MSARLRFAWALLGAVAVVVVPLRVMEIAAAHAATGSPAIPAAPSTAQR